LRYDYRRPKHPYSDKFMLAGGHCIPTCYALWMILGQAMAPIQGHGRPPLLRRSEGRDVADRRSRLSAWRGSAQTLLQDAGLADHPLFAQAKGRGIRAFAGHAESTDLTNDVNGGPSGVGVALAAGKAAFWDVVGAPAGTRR
jgi:hypothetical protein